jgi:chromatin structure-remodeling complex subunit RSC1/2
MSGVSHVPPVPSPSPLNQASLQTYNQQYATRPSPSPAPMLQHHNSYGSQGSNQQSLSQTPVYQSQQSYNQYAAPNTPVAANPLANYNSHYQNAVPNPRPVAQNSMSHNSHQTAYNPPKAVEVYTLSDTANAAIPTDIRDQFHRDEYGRVIFYTAPPLAIPPVPEEKAALGHSLRYLADKARSKDEDEKKRKALEAQLESDASERLKRMRMDAEGKKQWILEQKVEALDKWSKSMEKGTDELYKQMYGEKWKEVRDADLNRLAVQQVEASAKQQDIENWDKMKGVKDVKITGFKWI